MEARFEKIDAMLQDPKSEINTDCLLPLSTSRFSSCPSYQPFPCFHPSCRALLELSLIEGCGCDLHC
ncbi:hypothetical protein ATANTOWER_006429 [Ataeniobius toweri]|uniref:Uncharacterized protein n=1 Tax=Ataeniobius toweri TaxID=208326 RepID=A0ABU7ATC3_9TELE|nr:hypothetical protein [Ataeniobius toweri]